MYCARVLSLLVSSLTAISSLRRVPWCSECGRLLVNTLESTRQLRDADDKPSSLRVNQIRGPSTL
eukprot:3286533-Karenia_brevis.AAC.1